MSIHVEISPRRSAGSFPILVLRSARRPFTLHALERYRKTKVHFVHCLLAAPAAAEQTPVAIFDQDFRKFADVRVETQ